MIAAILRPLIVLSLAAAVGACGGSLRNEIEGNNTGGVIPPALVAGGNAQSLANAHCAKWNAMARVTFSGAEAGGDTIFVCETAAGPTMMGAPATQPPAPATKQAPAKR
jgi:hypothetical protein